MRLPEGVEWALHSAWLLALVPDDGALPARRLAEVYDLPQPYLAKILKSLVSAGVLTAVSGPRGGFRLARVPEEISVLDIVEALEGRTQVFRCAEIRQRGPAPLTGEACRRPCGIATVMYDAETEWRAGLAGSGRSLGRPGRRRFHLGGAVLPDLRLACRLLLLHLSPALHGQAVLVVRLDRHGDHEADDQSDECPLQQVKHGLDEDEGDESTHGDQAGLDPVHQPSPP